MAKAKAKVVKAKKAKKKPTAHPLTKYVNQLDELAEAFEALNWKIRCLSNLADELDDLIQAGKLNK